MCLANMFNDEIFDAVKGYENRFCQLLFYLMEFSIIL